MESARDSNLCKRHSLISRISFFANVGDGNLCKIQPLISSIGFLANFHCRLHNGRRVHVVHQNYSPCCVPLPYIVCLPTAQPGRFLATRKRASVPCSAPREWNSTQRNSQNTKLRNPQYMASQSHVYLILIISSSFQSQESSHQTILFCGGILGGSGYHWLGRSPTQAACPCYANRVENIRFPKPAICENLIFLEVSK